MKSTAVVLGFFFNVFATRGNAYPNNRIGDFITRENINAIVLFHCEASEWISWLRNYSGPFLSILMSSTIFYTDHHRLMSTGHHRFGLIADLSCSSAHDLLQFCSERSYFNGSYRWLLLNSVDTNKTFSYLESLNLNIDTRLSFIDRNFNSDESSFEWYEIYGKIRNRGGKNHIVKIDNVSSKTAVQGMDPNFGFRKRTCLDGVVLQAVVAVKASQILMLK